MKLEQQTEEMEFLWKVLNQEGIKQNISPAELKKKTGVTTNVINSRSAFAKLFEGLGSKVELVNFTLRIDDLTNLQSTSLEELDNVPFENQKHKEVLQKSPFKGEGLHVFDAKGNGFFLPMPSDMFLKKVLPSYIDEIAKKEPEVRKQFIEIERELRDLLHQKHRVVQIGENRFLKWFFREIDQTKISASGIFVTSPTTQYYHWAFNLDEFTPEIIQKHLDDYCRYVHSEFKKLPPVIEKNKSIQSQDSDSNNKARIWEPTKTDAVRVITRFNTYLENEAKKEAGKQTPKTIKEIVNVAIEFTCKDSSIEMVEKQLTRYIKVVYNQTAKQYGEHYVRQNFKGKIKGIS